MERKTRKGRVFYGCANYPECDFTSWKRPLRTPCPDCGGLLVIANKTTAQCTVCEHTFPLESVTPAGPDEGGGEEVLTGEQPPATVPAA